METQRTDDRQTDRQTEKQQTKTKAFYADRCNEWVAGRKSADNINNKE